MDKTIVLGTFPETRKIGRYHSALHVKVRVETEDREGKLRLSICGETYYPGARDIESGGQILEDVRALLDNKAATLNKPREDIARLLEVWDRWHLNDMRPGCEHQRDWDTAAPVVLVTYVVRHEVYERRRDLEKRALAELATKGATTLAPEEQALMSLEWHKDIIRDADEPPPDPSIYTERAKDVLGRPSREVKTAGWVHPKESPKGLLGKPCPTCGYKYGTAWLYEEVPAEVLAFLESL